jgi:long-chain acyl-CoA synthetase
VSERAALDGLLTRAARRYPDRVALRTAHATVTFAQLDRRVNRLAAALSQRVGRMAVIALAADLDVTFPVAYYGIVRAGGVVALVNPLLREELLARMLTGVGARAFVGGPPVTDRIRSISDRLPKLELVLTTGELDSLPIAESRPDDGARPVGDLAVIQFTSGTTRDPKAVMLTNAGLLSNADQIAHAHGLSPAAVTLNNLPTFHPMHLNSAVHAMAAQVLCPADDAAEAIAMANEHHATHYYSLPVRLARLARDPRLSQLHLSTVRAILSGGSALAPQAAVDLRDHFGIAVVQGYGLAEMSPLTHADDMDRPTIGSVGRPLALTECRVVDVLGRHPLPPGTRGEVQVRGPQRMSGYLDPDEPTGIDAQGWLSTGDVGQVDESGLLYLTDRLKDVFKCDNWLVAPSEIEAVLAEHPGVADCCVIDRPDELRGAVACAFVVAREGDLAADEVTEFVNGKLPHYQHLHRVIVVEQIPRSPNGKILRRNLRQTMEG